MASRGEGGVNHESQASMWSHGVDEDAVTNVWQTRGRMDFQEKLKVNGHTRRKISEQRQVAMPAGQVDGQDGISKDTARLER